MIWRVRIDEIIPHERPRRARVRELVLALRAGERLPLIEVGPKIEHWTQGPRGMVSIGYGYGVIDGHHRLAAYRKVLGAGGVIRVRVRT